MFDDFVSHLVDERKLSPQTAKFYTADLAHFQEFMNKQLPSWWQGNKEKPISGATQEEVQAYVDALKDRNYKPRSISRKVSTLSTYFRFLVRKGRIAASPIQHQGERRNKLNIQKPKFEKSDIKYLSDQEVDVLISSIKMKTDLFTLRDRAMYLLIFKTGLRVPEIQSIQMGDVNFLSHELRYKPMHKSVPDAIVMTPEIEKAVEAYYFARLRTNPEMPDEAPFFANKNGNTISSRSVRRNLDNHAAKVNLHVNPSQLRHSFALSELRKGASIEDVQKKLGHMNPLTTQIYVDKLGSEDLGPAAPVEELEPVMEPVTSELQISGV